VSTWKAKSAAINAAVDTEPVIRCMRSRIIEKRSACTVHECKDLNSWGDWCFDFFNPNKMAPKTNQDVLLVKECKVSELWMSKQLWMYQQLGSRACLNTHKMQMPRLPIVDAHFAFGLFLTL
jgi:hypothetical protein